MGEYSEAFVAFDVAKEKRAVAIAEGGRSGEVRFLGEVENRPAVIERMIKKLGKRYNRLHVCFEAGPTGYGLCRQVRDLGHDCMVVAPALIPKRSGEWVKTNRHAGILDAVNHLADAGARGGVGLADGRLPVRALPEMTPEADVDLVLGGGLAEDDLEAGGEMLAGLTAFTRTRSRTAPAAMAARATVWDRTPPSR